MVKKQSKKMGSEQKLKLYKATSDWPEIETLNTGLYGKDIDGNMLFLYGKSIKNISITDDNKLKITCLNGDVITSDPIKGIDDCIFTLDKENGTLAISSPDGNVISIEGFLTKESLKVQSESPLFGLGTEKSPLRINQSYVGNDAGTVSFMFLDEVVSADATNDDVWNKYKSNFKDDEVPSFLYVRESHPCFGTTEITVNEYVVRQGNDIRPLKNGDHVTFIGNGNIPVSRYVIEKGELKEVVEGVNNDDKVLSIKENGLSSTISLKRGKIDGKEKILLTGLDDEIISSINVEDFLMDTALKDVEVVEHDDESFIVFTVSVIDENGMPKDSQIEIPVSSLTDDIETKVDDEIASLTNEVNTLKSTVTQLNTAIANLERTLSDRIDCLEKSTIREISGTDNQIKVSTEKMGNSGKKVSIGFSDDTYFIAG